MKDVVLNVAEIYALSYDLLRELEKRMEEWYAHMCFSWVL